MNKIVSRTPIGLFALMLIVKYGNGKTETTKVNLTPGTYGNQQFSKQITLARKVVKVTARVQAGRAKGIFYVDDLAVIEILSPATIVPDLRLSN